MSSKDIAHICGEKIKIFISYAPGYRQDAILRMSDYLKDKGRFKVWIDIDNLSDMSYEFTSISNGINEAQVFLCFFSKAYVECDTCMQALKFAVDIKKEILPIKMEYYQPDGLLEFLLSDKVQVNYTDSLSFKKASKGICKLIEQNIAEQRELPKQMNDLRFKIVGVPYFVKCKLFERKAIEDNILSEFLKIASAEEGGILGVHGEGGVGKSTLIASVLYDQGRTPFFVNDCGINRVFWVNCFNWRNDFGEKAFYEKITSLAEEMDTELQFETNHSPAKRFSIMLQFYHKQNIKIAYVLDDVFNGEEIESLLSKHGRISPPVCFVLSRHLETFIAYQWMTSDIRLQELADSDIEEMLKNTFELHKLLDEEQLGKLASLCCGLPLIANLVASRIKYDTTEVEVAYNALISNLPGQLRHVKIRDKYKSQSNLTVFTLLSFSLEEMDSNDRMFFYAFLLFNPAEPVDIGDLDVLWGKMALNKNKESEVKLLCRQFERRCLLRRLNPKFPWEKNDRFLVHQTLFEAAVLNASKDLKLSETLSEEERLYCIRLKFVSCQVNPTGFTDNSGLGILVNCVKKNNSNMLNRIMQHLTVEDLTELLEKASLILTKGQLFSAFAFDNLSFRMAILQKIYSNIDVARYILGRQPKLVDIRNNNGDTALHTASWDGRLDIVKLLLGISAEIINVKNIDGDTALHKASLNAHVDILKHLLEVDPQIAKIQNNDGDTALHYASRKGLVQVVEFLLEIEPNLVNIKSESGDTALHYASRNGHLGVVEVIQKLAPGIVNIINRDGTTAFQYAIRNNHYNIVKLLLEKSPQIANITDESGNTELHIASRNGNVEVVKFLFNEAPQLSKIENDIGYTALDIASRDGNLNIVKFIVKKAPHIVTVKDKKGAAELALGNGHLAITNFLVAKEPELASIIGKGSKSLAAASSHGHQSLAFLEPLRAFVDFNTTITDRCGDTKLHHASQFGNLRDVEYLLSQKPQIATEANKYGNTALHHASWKGHLNVVKVLVEKAPKLVKIGNTRGDIAAQLAYFNGHLDIVKYLLGKEPQLVNYRDKEGNTILHAASAKGDLDMVEFLLEKDPQLVNATNKIGNTAVHSASRNDHLEVLQLLLEVESQLTSKDVCRNVIPAGFKFLLKQAAENINNTDGCGNTELHIACRNGQYYVVKFILAKAPGLLKLTNKYGDSALHAASLNGHLEVIKLLLEREPQLAYFADEGGWTALHYASRNGHVNVVDRLLDDDMLHRVTDECGWTALHWAALNGHLDVVKTLLSKAPHIANIKANDGETALHSASWQGHLAIVKMILKTPGHISKAQNHDGDTALHFACRRGNLEIVMYLLKEAPELISIKAKNGRTALDYASKCRYLAIVNALIRMQPRLVDVDFEENRLLRDKMPIFIQQYISNSIREKNGFSNVLH